jgi:hypothetical protein
MVDRERYEAAERREQRHWELILALQRALEAGEDTQPVRDEMDRLHAEDDNYIAGLVAEIDADHTIRRASVAAHAEQIRQLVELIPDGDPRRPVLLRLAGKLVAGEPFSADDLTWLRQHGSGDTT